MNCIASLMICFIEWLYLFSGKLVERASATFLRLSVAAVKDHVASVSELFKTIGVSDVAISSALTERKQQQPDAVAGVSSVPIVSLGRSSSGNRKSVSMGGATVIRPESAEEDKSKSNTSSAHHLELVIEANRKRDAAKMRDIEGILDCILWHRKRKHKIVMSRSSYLSLSRNLSSIPRDVWCRGLPLDFRSIPTPPCLSIKAKATDTSMQPLSVIRRNMFGLRYIGNYEMLLAFCANDTNFIQRQLHVGNDIYLLPLPQSATILVTEWSLCEQTAQLSLCHQVVDVVDLLDMEPEDKETLRVQLSPFAAVGSGNESHGLSSIPWDHPTVKKYFKRFYFQSLWCLYEQILRISDAPKNLNAGSQGAVSYSSLGSEAVSFDEEMCRESIDSAGESDGIGECIGTYLR